MAPKSQSLTLLIVAQWACTSLWFASNAALPSLNAELALEGGVGALTAAVQLGFIGGAALVALSGLADRVASHRLFFVAACVGALANVAPIAVPDARVLAASRVVVGASLAGIYPVGMKLAASWKREGLGTAMGYLVGALVLGTALPHLLGGVLPWRTTFGAVSLLAFAGGLVVAVLLREGPYTRSQPFRFRDLRLLARGPNYRRALLGYLGHMWELYVFWALAPALLAETGWSAPQWPFAVIGIGAVGCAIAGHVAQRFGPRSVARVAMVTSGVACLLAPWLHTLPRVLALAFLLLWGLAVVADSPLLSTLTAHACPPELKGTGLALATSLGFGATVVSLFFADTFERPAVAMAALGLGPLLGALALRNGALPALAPSG
ncbi:MAG: MFS transporter [Myxococcota bacterium]